MKVEVLKVVNVKNTVVWDSGLKTEVGSFS